MRAALFVLASIAFVAIADASLAYQYMDCGDKDCYWPDYPVAYHISSRGTPDTGEERGAVKGAFDRWSSDRQTFCTLEFEEGGPTDANNFSGSDNRNLVFWVEDGWEYGDAALAVTICTYYVDSGKMVDCDIGLNGEDFIWTASRDGEGQDLRDTLTHEIGHLWGLDHSAIQTATMYAYYNPTYLTADLDFDDIDGAFGRFCDGTLETDDDHEPNDSLINFEPIEADVEYPGLRLYDHDVYKASVQKGDSLGVSIEDDSSTRVKGVKLYDGNRVLLDERTCTGDCSAYFGEFQADGSVFLKIYAAFDVNKITREEYGFALKTDASPDEDDAEHGAPFDVEEDDPPADDDEGGSGSDGGGACGCGELI